MKFNSSKRFCFTTIHVQLLFACTTLLDVITLHVQLKTLKYKPFHSKNLKTFLSLKPYNVY